MPGGGGGLLPVLLVGHDLGEGLLSLPVELAQVLVGDGQGVLLCGAAAVADLAGGVGFGGGAGGAEAGVEGAEAGVEGAETG